MTTIKKQNDILLPLETALGLKQKPNPWVAEHLRQVAGFHLTINDEGEVLTKDGARAAVEDLGVNGGFKGKFAAQVFSIAGNFLASLTTSGNVWPFQAIKVLLKVVGPNHLTSNSGIVDVNGDINQAQLDKLKGYAGEKDHLSLDDLVRFLRDRREEIVASLPAWTPKRLGRIIGNMVLSPGELGPLFDVAKVTQNGELVLPLLSVDKFYKNKLFDQIRAEREAATIVDAPEHNDVKSTRALVKFASEQGGALLGDAADLARVQQRMLQDTPAGMDERLAFAKLLLQGRDADLERLRNGIDLQEIAKTYLTLSVGSSFSDVWSNAASVARLICPFFKGAQRSQAPAGASPKVSMNSESAGLDKIRESGTARVVR
jgi:hypothetical protein